jgi:aquaporin NIP
MEEQKCGMGVPAVTVPPMPTSESNRISIIISPRATSSKVMQFELLSAGSVSSHPPMLMQQLTITDGIKAYQR